ncbi:MAG: Asp-tRNA(Asn)/Glu-tRNA(Gln) amidotransferase subunit GatC [Bacilli bacterium]|nr:Asp-tRNA(Asn)/Glu-tRNA(Gln) amidotransferase subunit GatC [Bacilli bacterium]
MKPVNKSVLEEAAQKLMFEMDEKQYDTLLEEFHTILSQLELIGEIPGVDEVEPMTFPFDVTNSFLREDVTQKPLDRDVALKNASDVVDGQIRLPKVVG